MLDKMASRIFQHLANQSLILVLLLLTFSALAASQGGNASLQVTVHDDAGNAVSGVPVSVTAHDGKQLLGTTNEAGVCELAVAQAGSYSVTISGEAFQAQTQKNVVVAAGTRLDLEFTAIAKITVRQQVSVEGSSENPVEVGASPPSELQREQVKTLPSKPVTVAEALPLLPGVARTTDGQIEIAGAGEVHSAMLVNSVDVTDPQTGQFGMTIPVDSVETIRVFKTPYLAEYGRFSAGVVAVDTKRGSEKWHVDLQDPFPEFRIRSGHLVGLRNASPRFNFGGPLLKDRLFGATSIEYVLDKKPVRTLPFPFNESRVESLNLFTQLDYMVSSNHMVTATFHTAPQTAKFVNLDFFNPQTVTPNLGAVDQTGTLIDRLSLHAGLLQSTFAIRAADISTDPQGDAEMFLTPVGNKGNYFSSQDRNSRRYQWIENFSFKPLTARGVHNIETGFEVSQTGTRGIFTARPVNILDSLGQLRQRIEFQGGTPYQRSDWELDGFVQDHWVMNKRLSVDAGLRTENQRLSSSVRMAPRIGFAFSPWPSLGIAVRGGAGVFYDHVPLSVYAFQSYPQHLVTTFSANGKVIDGPRLFLNAIDRSNGPGWPLIDGEPQSGNFNPYSFARNLEVEKQFSSHLKLRAGYLQTDSHGQVIINPGLFRATDALVLSGTGESRYRQFEITGVAKFKSVRQLFFSYVRSRARGNINQFNRYLGDVPYPVIQSGQFTNLSGDLPNRFLAWGTIGIPLKMEVSPFVEFHTGFPYAVTDVLQRYVGTANSDNTRFPRYFSLDARLSCNFRVSSKYGLQLALTGLNLTNHFNALAVHSNIADPQFGQFFGTYKRRFRIDFDVLF